MIEEMTDKSEPQVQRGRRIRQPKKEWPEEDFHSSKNKSVGKKQIEVDVHIEPITQSIRDHHITSTADDAHGLLPQEQPHRSNAEVQPNGPNLTSQIEEVKKPSQREQGTLPEDPDGPSSDPTQSVPKSITF